MVQLVANSLEVFLRLQRRVTLQEFTAFLDTAIGYVRKWFNFSDDNWHFHVQPLCLTSGKISYDDMEKIIEKLHLVDRLNLSMDELYDECVTANGVLGHLKGRQDWPSKGTAEKWVEVLRGLAADLPNILAVVSFVLSIPSSTGVPCSNEACQETVRKLTEETALRSEVYQLREKVSKLSFSQESFKDNDDMVQDFTGIPSFAKLMVVFTFVSEFLKVV
ncbi:unnamed protein product [Gadus morhua 'NCC']